MNYVVDKILPFNVIYHIKVAGVLYLKVTGVELDCDFEEKRIGMMNSWELVSVYIG